MNLVKTKKQVITYTVNRSNIDDLYICVQNGEVMVNAPWQLSNKYIQEIIEEKRQWIIKKLENTTNQWKDEASIIERSPVKVFGKDYKIRIQYKNIKVAQLDVEKETIKMTLPNKYKKINHDKILDLAIDKMYESIARDELEKIMEKTRILLGFAPENYEIKKLKNQLAICKDKNIIFDINIVKYRKEIIEYIVLHEFCHLKYQKHSKAFYQFLEKYMLNYKEYEKEIKEFKF